DTMDVDESSSTKTVESKDIPIDAKFTSVFQRFKSSTTNVEDAESSSEDEDALTEKHDLVPLPQPDLPRDQRLSRINTSSLDWLGKVDFVDTTTTKPFDTYALHPTLLRNLEAGGFRNAFSVQVGVLDKLLPEIKTNQLAPDSHGDLLVNASTGSGKTLAYSIPLIQSLSSRIVPRLRAIVLVPTKPLINQVRATLSALAKGTNLHIATLKNDISLKEEHEKLLANCPDIIVSTPGRLVDHLTMKSVDLVSLQWLVIDEADRLLNQSFQNWAETLISTIDRDQGNKNTITNKKWVPPLTKMIFSATLTTDAGKLTGLKFQQPRILVVNDSHELVNEMFTVPKALTEYTVRLSSSSQIGFKPLLLLKLLYSNPKLRSNVLVFTKSNESSIRLTRLLQILATKHFSFSAGPLSIQYVNSTISTAARTKILAQFSAGTVNVLIATDLIARGLDISTIRSVVNYDLPNSAREYVHRVGRTARANQDGDSYSLLVGNGEFKWFMKLMRDVERSKVIVTAEEDKERGVVIEKVNETEEAVYKEALQALEREVFEK
ncbi:hypothetical protein BABINDRAFT_26411, partial [Babjeviella inositovora NRRL Y-12698]